MRFLQFQVLLGVLECVPNRSGTAFVKLWGKLRSAAMFSLMNWFNFMCIVCLFCLWCKNLIFIFRARTTIFTFAFKSCFVLSMSSLTKPKLCLSYFSIRMIPMRSRVESHFYSFQVVVKIVKTGFLSTEFLFYCNVNILLIVFAHIDYTHKFIS